jgi:hypothetical protein
MRSSRRLTHNTFRARRGAVLVHVAVGMVALTALTALSIDYGVLWVSRRQIQNAADAGALAGATYLAFYDKTNQSAARDAALGAVQRNSVWGSVPDVTSADITFPACPPGAPGLPDTCVKVNVFRNQRAGGNPLPTFSLGMVGITKQGVQATATAQVLAGDTAKCVKPWALADKWAEHNPKTKPWDFSDTFDPTGKTPDVYIAPSPTSPGTGFSMPTDWGLQVVLNESVSSSWHSIVDLGGPGGADYRTNIETCNPFVVVPGQWLVTEPGAKVGPTKQGVDGLVSQDPGAHWDPTALGGKGAPVGGCMAAGTCISSPRVVPIAMYDPSACGPGGCPNGRGEVQVSNMVGMWVEGMSGKDVIGYMMPFPGLATGSSSYSNSSFVRTVILVR